MFKKGKSGYPVSERGEENGTELENEAEGTLEKRKMVLV